LDCVSEAIRPVVEMLETRQLLTAITGASFNYLTAPQNVTLNFDTNVQADLSLDDLVVDRLSNNTTLARTNQSLAYNTSTNVATVTFPGEANQGITGMLPDGNFQTIVSEEGIPGMTSEHLLNFFFLTADVNRDRAVSSADEAIVTANFGTSGNFAAGDVNLDGVINLDDYTTLSNNFGRQQPAPITTANTLTVAALSSSANQLTWTKPDAAVDGYRIYRSTDGTNFTQIADVATTPRSYDDTGLTDGTKYWYRVRPYTVAEGNSATTNKMSAVTVLPAPTGVVASEDTDEFSSGTAVNWDHSGTTIEKYVIERATDSTFTTNLVSFDVTYEPEMPSGSFVDRGVVGGQTYFYRVRAMNSVAESAASSAVSVIAPHQKVFDPVDIKIVATGSLAFEFAWGDFSSNETNYEVQRATDAEFLTDVQTTTLSADVTFVTQTVPAAGLYFLRVRAYNANVTSAWVETSIDTSKLAPEAPVGLQVEPLANGEFSLLWGDAATNETSFIVQRSTDPTFTTNVLDLATLPAGSTEYVDIGAKDSEATFYYRIRAVSPSNHEAFSDIVEEPETQASARALLIQRHTGSIFQTSKTNETDLYISGVPIHVRVRESALGPDFDDVYGTKLRYTWYFDSTTVVTGLSAAHVFYTSDFASTPYPTHTIKLRVEKEPSSGSTGELVREENVTLRVRPHLAQTGESSSNFIVYNVYKNLPQGVTNDGIQTGNDSTRRLRNTNWETIRTAMNGTLPNLFKNSVVFRLERGQEFDLPKGLDLRNTPVTRVIFEDFGTAQSLPTLDLKAANRAFWLSSNNSQFSFRNLRLTSTNSAHVVRSFSPSLTNPPSSVTNQVAGRASATAPTFLTYDNATGPRCVAIIGCEFGYLSNAVNVDVEKGAGTPEGLYIADSKTAKNVVSSGSDAEDDYIVTSSYSIFAEGVTNLFIARNDFHNSWTEHVIRLNRDNKYVNVSANSLTKRSSGGTYSVTVNNVTTSYRALLSDPNKKDTATLRVLGGRYVKSTDVTERGLMHVSRNELRGGETWLGPLGGVVQGNDLYVGEKTTGLVFDANVIRFGTVNLKFGLEQSVIRNNIWSSDSNQPYAMVVKGIAPVQLYNDGSSTLKTRRYWGPERVIQDVSIVNNTIVKLSKSGTPPSVLKFDNPFIDSAAEATGNNTVFSIPTALTNGGAAWSSASPPARVTRAADYHARIKNLTFMNNLLARTTTGSTSNAQYSAFGISLDPLEVARYGDAGGANWKDTLTTGATKWAVGDNVFSTSNGTPFGVGTRLTASFPSSTVSSYTPEQFNRLSADTWNGATYFNLPANDRDLVFSSTLVNVRDETDSGFGILETEYRPISSSILTATRRSDAWFDFEGSFFGSTTNTTPARAISTYAGAKQTPTTA